MAKSTIDVFNHVEYKIDTGLIDFPFEIRAGDPMQRGGFPPKFQDSELKITNSVQAHINSNFLHFLNWVFVQDSTSIHLFEHQIAFYQFYLPLFKAFGPSTKCDIQGCIFVFGSLPWGDQPDLDETRDISQVLRIRELFLSFSQEFFVEINDLRFRLRSTNICFDFARSFMKVEGNLPCKLPGFSLNMPNRAEDDSEMILSLDWFDREKISIRCLETAPHLRFMQHWNIDNAVSKCSIMSNPLRCQIKVTSVDSVIGKTKIVLFPRCKHFCVLPKEAFFVQNVLLKKRTLVNDQIHETELSGTIYFEKDVWISTYHRLDTVHVKSPLRWDSKLYPTKVPFWFEFFSVKVPKDLEKLCKCQTELGETGKVGSVILNSTQLILTFGHVDDKDQELDLVRPQYLGKIHEVVIDFETRDVYLDQVLLRNSQVGNDVYSRMRTFQYDFDSRFLFE